MPDGTASSKLRIVLLGLCLALVTRLATGPPARATTYEWLPDAALLEQASHVAELGFLRTIRSVAGDAAATEHTAVVTRPLKGSFPSSVVRVRLPGGRDPGGAILWVQGLPAPRPGDDAIVFLERNDDGTFGVLHWALGYFRRVALGQGGPLALRDLRGAELVGGSARPDPQQERDYDAFAAWLGDRARGLRRAPDYFRERPAGALRPRYNLFAVSGKNLRWVEFDGGGTVDFRVRSAGSFGSAGQLTPAMRAWVRDPSTPVSLRVAGGTSSTAGLSRSDGVNSLIFGDPNKLMPGKYQCGAGGTLATGGVWFVRQTTRFRGRSHFRIVEGDIVVNDGVECLLKGQPARSAEVFTHELGHTLGIGHSCGDAASGPCTNAAEKDATMRATAHFDGRAASIRSDDAAALKALYQAPGGGGPGDPPPPDDPGSPGANLQPPANLEARALSGKRVELTWQDRSTGEGGYEVWIKSRGSEWTAILTLAANSTAARVDELDKGTKYKFKVRAVAGGRTSGFSEIVQVATLGRAAPAEPSDLEALEVAATRVVLGWRDNSDNEKAFVIWQKEGDGDWRVRRKVGANVTESALSVSPSTEYGFRIRGKNGRKLSGFSNVVTVTTPAA